MCFFSWRSVFIIESFSCVFCRNFKEWRLHHDHVQLKIPWKSDRIRCTLKPMCRSLFLNGNRLYMSSNSYSTAVPLFFFACASSRPLNVPGGQLRRDVEGTHPGLTQPNTVSQHTRCTKNTWTQRVCWRSYIWFPSETSVLLLGWCVFTVLSVPEVPFMFASIHVRET
jgi:hypothetical protein